MGVGSWLDSLMTDFPRIAALKNPQLFRDHLTRSQIPLEFDDQVAAAPDSPLARSFEMDGVRIGNRFCVLPMEGWDGAPDGKPSDLTIRRWRNFGLGGAKAVRRVEVRWPSGTVQMLNDLAVDRIVEIVEPAPKPTAAGDRGR